MDGSSHFHIDEVLTALNTDSPLAARRAVGYVEQYQETGIPSLLAAMTGQDTTTQRRILSLLVEYSEKHRDTRLVEPMLELLTSPDPVLAGRALEILAGFAGDIWPELLDRMPMCNTLVQIQLLKALSCVTDTRLVPPLMQLLQETNYASMRYTLIELLGNLAKPGATEVIELIQRYADDPDHHVRSRVKRALEKLTTTSLS